MPNIEEVDAMPRRALHIFYVLDTSGSMVNQPIAALNRAMEETVDALKDVAKKNGDAQLKISVLEFNTDCRWMQPKGPEDVEDFYWKELSAEGMTYIGKALTELDSKLSRNEFLRSITGSYLPVIIFMTDGYANDEYKGPLERIRNNNWYARSTKIGFAIGDSPDEDMIAEIVGEREAVIRTNDLSAFAHLIKMASVTSSMMASKSRTSEQSFSGVDIVRDIAVAETSSGQGSFESATPAGLVDLDAWGDVGEW